MIDVLITGDFCPIGRVVPYLNTNNYKELFGDLLPKIQESDLSITNLECPITNSNNRISKTGPHLKSEPLAARLLKSSGFNLVTLANNHIMDFGYEGLSNTFQYLKDESISWVGAGDSQEEANKPFVYTKNDLQIAIFNFSDNEWGTTYGSDAGTAPIDIINNYNLIKDAKIIYGKVLIITHAGNENYPLPSIHMKKLFRFYIDAGADAVINHHTHCISGFEVYKESPIYYSLGNFIFDSERRDDQWTTGMAVILSFSKERLSFKHQTFIQCRNKPGVSVQADNSFAIINHLNNIISDDKKLELEFRNFSEAASIQYYIDMEPHSIKLLQALQNRKIIPSLWSQKKKKFLLNLVRCESHRDVVIEILRENL